MQTHTNIVYFTAITNTGECTGSVKVTIPESWRSTPLYLVVLSMRHKLCRFKFAMMFWARMVLGENGVGVWDLGQVGSWASWDVGKLIFLPFVPCFFCYTRASSSS